MDNSFKVTDEILSNSYKSMNVIVEKIFKIGFDEIDEFEFPLDEAFGLQIIYNDTLYCLIVRFSSNNNNLICMGPGYHFRDEILSNGEIYKPPFFDRWSWFKYFKESFIAYSDPLMFFDDELNIGWFVGTKDEWYLKSLADIIDKLAKNQKIINENILFFGSSGGGFSSIVLATLIKNSKVLINNSQFFILNYNKPTLDKLFSSISPTFKGETRDEIIDEIKHRLDVIELFEKMEYAPFITYYLNSVSKGDIIDQTIPLLKKIRESDYYNGIDIKIYSQNKKVPHEPLPVNKSVDIIKKYCKTFLYNSDGHILKSDEYFIFNESNHVKRLEKENRDLINSRSWKITKPLRKFKRIFKG